MFRRFWSFPTTLLTCLLLLAACGQPNGAAPATATTSPTATTAAAATQRSATATPRQATATAAAQAPAASASAKGDPQSIVLGKPVMIKETTLRTVVAVEVKNTGDRYATFNLQPKQRSSGKPTLTLKRGVTAMPPGATWTVTLIADEVQAREYDLFDVSVEGYFAAPQTIDPTVAQKIKLTEPVVAVQGQETRATVEATNENGKRVTFSLSIIFVKDGSVTAVAQWPATLEPGQTQKFPLLVEGTPDGAVPHTQVSNIGGL